MPSRRTDAEREAITIAVLEAPIEMSHREVGKQVSLHRDTVRQIRYGVINTDIAPHLQRLEPGTFTRCCTGCVHFTRYAVRSRLTGMALGRCDLGFVESTDLTYARGCGAFWPTPIPS